MSAEASSTTKDDVKFDKEQEENIKKAVDALKKAKRVVAFTGAGMSAESGITTFRGTTSSLWSGFFGLLGMSIFGTPVGWNWISGISWKAYNNFFYSEIQRAKPNKGHLALAELEKKYKPKNFLVVTQNVDGLHQAAGNTEVAEIHGTSRKFKCVKHSHPYSFPGAAAVGFKLPDSAPVCPTCGSRIRPDVVFFTETLPEDQFMKAENAVQKLSPNSGDVMLIIGTSANVYPAARFPEVAYFKGVNLIEINIQPTPFSELSSTLFIKGKVGDILPRIVKELETQ